jgi:hypothetical protein
MHPSSFAKTTGAHFVAAWLAAVAMACDSPDVFDIGCRDLPVCPGDASPDAPRRDTPLPPDGVVTDSGPSRSLLCGTTGCFPGNWYACGQMPMPDAASFALHMQDDASNDVAPDAQPDATEDGGDATGTPDATPDRCEDTSHDGSSVDVSIDTSTPDAPPEDVAIEPDVAEDAPQDTAVDSAPPIDVGGTPDGGSRPDAAIDVARDMGTSDAPRIVQSCYIKPAATGVVTECAPVGPGAEGSNCNDSHDCGALLACVEVDQRAVCRAVSCALPAVCLRGTYYQEAPLRVNGATRRDLNIPVCLPADNCTLLVQPSPCAPGKVCAVVGSEGETTCMEPGSAKVGELCDETSRCAEGLLCSRFSNQCVKICHIDAGPQDCPTGTCQGGSGSLPDGFGICVGQTDGGR